MRWVRLRLVNLGPTSGPAHRAHSDRPDHARRSGGSRNQSPRGIAGRIQAAPPSPRGGRRRVRFHRGRNHGRGHPRAVSRRHRRRIRRLRLEPQLEDESVLVLEGSVNIRDLETQHGLLLPRDAGFETLAGFVLARLQRIPIPERILRIRRPPLHSRRDGRSPNSESKDRKARRRGRQSRTSQAAEIEDADPCHPERSEGPLTRLCQHKLRKRFLPLPRDRQN